MKEKGLFILGGLGTHLHDIIWAVHDGKSRGRSEGEENFGEFSITMDGRGQAMHGGLCASLVHVHMCVQWCDAPDLTVH